MKAVHRPERPAMHVGGHHNMPVRVFEMEKQGVLLSIVRGGEEGTLIE